MTEWLKILIALSVSGSLIFILSCLITYLTKKGINAKLHYWNRKIALLFFITPIFMIIRIFSIFEKESQLLSMDNIIILAENRLLITDQFVQALFIIWITGVVITSMRFLYSFHRFNKVLSPNLVSIPEEQAIKKLLDKKIAEMKLRDNVKIKLCQVSISPVLIGVLKPTIILPMYDIPHDELDMILQHELTHLKKKDLWIKWCMMVATILHWYNPLVYYLQKEIEKWSEYSCDEDVVMTLSYSERKKYGQTILNMIKSGEQDLTSIYTGAAFTRKTTNIKKRLMKILQAKRISKSILLASTLGLLILGSVGIVSALVTHDRVLMFSEQKDQENNDITTIYSNNGDIQKNNENNFELNSVKESDKSRFTEEDWEAILQQVENGDIILVGE